METLSEQQLRKYMEKAREKRILPLKILNELEEKLVNYIQIAEKEGKPQLTKKSFEKILQETIKAYHFSQVDPGSAVGTIAAQSIGEPGTQMSLPGDELVIVREGKTSKIVPIGEFIENLFERYGMSYHDTDGTALLGIPESVDIFVLGLGSDEKIKWQKLVEVSRHPPNGDLLRITTRSGRKITATFSHSFVVRRNNQIVPIKGKDLVLGDRIPLVTSIPVEKPLTHLSVYSYLEKNNVLATLELQIAHSRSSELGQEYNSSKLSKTLTKIPEKIPLTPEFGWFIGAFLAEGSVTANFIAITSNNEEYLQKAVHFAELFGARYHLKEKQGEYGQATTLYIHSPILATLSKLMCGENEENKVVPGWVLNTSSEFISSLLRGYFDGDDNIINIQKGIILASAHSKSLRDIIALLLARLGIFAKKSDEKQHQLLIPAKYAPRFLELIGSDIPYRLNVLKELVDIRKEKEEQTYDLNDMIPGIGNIIEELQKVLNVPSELDNNFSNKQLISREALGNYIQLFKRKANERGIDISGEIKILEQAYNSDVLWDEIIKLEKVSSPTPFVYDFSVPGLETFVTAEGLVTHNTLQTYHYAGVAEFNVTLGLPRLIEIVDARRNPNTPAMWVYLEKNLRQDQEKAKAVARQLELTKVINVAKSVDIELFENRVRIVLDPELMEDKGLTVDDVVQKLQYRRRQKVFAEGYNVYVQSEKEEPVLQDLQRLSEKVKEIPLKGLKGITRAMIKVNKYGPGDDDWEYYIRCEGSNFTGALRIPGVDATRTTTNHIHEIAETLGIEAARTAIIKEAKKVLDDQGLDVDTRHITLVADLMTYSGEIHQIGRHGISGEKSSVFARAAFEVTVKHLLDAAIYGQKERLQGIVENVIVGQTIKLGTGIVDLAISPNYREYADKPLNIDEVVEESS